MKRVSAIIATVAALLALIFVLRLYAIAEPQTAIGYALFRVSYDAASDKSVVLRGFAANLEKYNGFYIPESADRFLCSRLEQPLSQAEFVAITEFYIDKSYGRAGQCVYHLPAPTKARITELILRRLDFYPTDKAESALILLETLRQGQSLGKARFIGSDERTHSRYEQWKEETALPVAKSRFRKWDERYPNWAQKESHDPLANSGFEIAEP